MQAVDPFTQGVRDEQEGADWRFYPDQASAEQYEAGRRAGAIPAQEIYEPPAFEGEQAES